MRFIVWSFAAFTIIQAVAPVALGLEIGGGGSALAGRDTTVNGIFEADNAGASSIVAASGSIPHAGELRFVQDSDGKRAQIMFDVTGASGVKYSASFSPSEGAIGSVATAVAASQSLAIRSADSIFIHTAAQSGSNIAVTNLTAACVGTFPASFSGSAKSTADAESASASIQGRVVGAVNGTAGFGGSIGGPHTADKARDSLGQKIDCSLVMQASSTSGNGTFSGVSAFSVDPTRKIQDAINASWDGDVINIAKGTYRENLVLDKSLTLKGAGSSKTAIDGNNSGSVFTIGRSNNSTTVSLSGMTIQNGSADYGGGISNFGTLTVTGSKIIENRARFGGGVCNKDLRVTLIGTTISENYAEDAGGAVYSLGLAEMTGSTVSGNRAFLGGGVYSEGMFTAAKCTISKNSGIGGGGGVYIGPLGMATVTGSKISENYGEFGGGVFSDGTLVIGDSTLSGNAASFGGAISSSGILIATNSAISSNSAQKGGGIFSAGTSMLDKCTFSGNIAIEGGGLRNDGTTMVKGCIFSGNSAQWGGAFHNDGSADLIGVTASSNSAMEGGAICNDGTLYIGGTSSITGNKATAWYGGGIFSTRPSVTLDGTKVLVKNNRAHMPSSDRAHMPSSAGSWYRSWGVYLTEGMPVTDGGFDPSKQVTGNIRA